MEEILKYLMDWLPTLAMGVVLFYIQRRQQKRDKATDERAAARAEESFLGMRLSVAILKLSEILAIKIQGGKTNGEVVEAMKECKEVKEEYFDFINRQHFREQHGHH